MTAQTGKKTIAIHILPNISRYDSSQAMKFSQFITWEIFSFKNRAENKARTLVSDPFLFFNKLYIRSNQVINTLILMYFGRPSRHAIKTNYNISDCWSRKTLYFNFSQKRLALAFLPHFVYGFSRKIFLMLYSFNWLNFIV